MTKFSHTFLEALMQFANPSATFWQFSKDCSGPPVMVFATIPLQQT